MSALLVIIAAIIQKYNHAWTQWIVLGFNTFLRLIKFAQGKGTLGAEKTRPERNKDNSVIERTKDFLKQLAKPFQPRSQKRYEVFVTGEAGVKRLYTLMERSNGRVCASPVPTKTLRWTPTNTKASLLRHTTAISLSLPRLWSR